MTQAPGDPEARQPSPETGRQRQFGMGRGKVFPEADAKSLLNPLRRLLQSPSRTVSAMGLTTTDRVLEIGAGPGFFSPYIAAKVPEGHVVVLDLQSEMVTLASRRLSSTVNVLCVQADAMDLPFDRDSFDAVLVATVLGEIPDVDRCLDEVRRVLRPNGILSVSETRRDSDFTPLSRLRPLVERHAFEFLERRGVGWQYLARFWAR